MYSSISSLSAVKILSVGMAFLLVSQAPCEAQETKRVSASSVRMVRTKGSLPYREPRVLSPEEKAVYLNEQAVEQVLKGGRSRGIEMLIEAHKLDPNNSTVLYNLGGLYLSQGQVGEAVKTLQDAVRLEPNDPAVLNRLAESYIAASKIPRAIECYERILTLDPDFYQALFRLGTLYSLEENWERAEELLRKASESDPSDYRALSHLGTVLVMQKKFPEAISLLEKAQKGQPSPENDIALGMAYQGVGNQEKAAEHMKRAKAQGLEAPSLEGKSNK